MEAIAFVMSRETCTAVDKMLQTAPRDLQSKLCKIFQNAMIKMDLGAREIPPQKPEDLI